MEINIEETSDTQKTITISAGESDLKPIVDEVFDQLRPRVEASGFRKGNAPNAIVEKELGSQNVQNEIVQTAVERLMLSAIDENNLRVIGSPEVNVKKFVPYSELEFTAELEVIGDIELPDYKNLDVERDVQEVEDEEIEEVLDNLRTRSADKEEVERAAQEGDEVEIDFKGFRDGEPVPGATANKYPLNLGSGKFIPGFEDEIIGLKPKDEESFTITFPADYQEESLAGNDVEFEVKVHSVKELKEVELDDEFAKSLGDFESLENLKQDIRKQLAEEKEKEADKEYENKIIEELKSKAKLTLPENQVTSEQERLWEEFNHKMQHQGSSAETELEKEGKSEEEFKEELTEQAKDRVRTALILTEIADREELQVNDHELQARINLLKTRYKDDSMQEQLESPQVQRNVANQLLTEKTVAKLVQYNKQEQGNK